MFSSSTSMSTLLNGIMKSYEKKLLDPSSGQIEGMPRVPKIQSDCSPEDVYLKVSQALPLRVPAGKVESSQISLKTERYLWAMLFGDYPLNGHKYIFP
jgi:hypothetical protein